MLLKNPACRLLLCATVLGACVACSKEFTSRSQVERHIINSLNDGITLSVSDNLTDMLIYYIPAKDTLKFSGVCIDEGDGFSCESIGFSKAISVAGYLSVTFSDNRKCVYGSNTCDSLGKDLAKNFQFLFANRDTCGYLTVYDTKQGITIAEYVVDSIDYYWSF